MINQQCIIDLLEANNIVVTYINNHGIGSEVTYHFGKDGTLDFEGYCVPNVAVLNALNRFNLGHLINQIQIADCLCGK